MGRVGGGSNKREPAQRCSRKQLATNFKGDRSAQRLDKLNNSICLANGVRAAADDDDNDNDDDDPTTMMDRRHPHHHHQRRRLRLSLHPPAN